MSMYEGSVSLESNCPVHLTHDVLVFIKVAFCSSTIWPHNNAVPFPEGPQAITLKSELFGHY